MKIEATEFELNYHESREAGNDLYGRYTLHTVDVYNSIWIAGQQFWAVYQTGVTYNVNDYDCPSPDLELSLDGGTDRMLVRIDNLYASDFDDADYITEVLSEITDLCSAIDTVEKLRAVYDTLMDNLPVIEHYI